MAILLGLLLFLLPFALYALWWRYAGQDRAEGPPLIALALGGAGLAAAVLLAIYFGQSRSLEPGEAYVPARIEGGTIRR